MQSDPTAAGQRPVAANQAPVGDVTKMIGAMHGFGSATNVLNLASPSADAGTRPVSTLVTVAAPPVTVWQLTIALKFGIGLVPRTPSGTGARRARTRPSTSIFSRPLAPSLPWASSISQGSPPPPTPRIGLAVPV